MDIHAYSQGLTDNHEYSRYIHGYSRIFTDTHRYLRSAFNQKSPLARRVHLGPYRSDSALMGPIWSPQHCDHTVLGAATRVPVVFQPLSDGRCQSGPFCCPQRPSVTACMRAASGPWVLGGLSATEAGMFEFFFAYLSFGGSTNIREYP
jgi:hypothetical protein